MDIKEKVTAALTERLHPEKIHLVDEDGISGYVVSAQFQQKSAMDRQSLIESALRDSTVKFSKPELRHILAIAALTPLEFAGIGPGNTRARRAPARKSTTGRNET